MSQRLKARLDGPIRWLSRSRLYLAYHINAVEWVGNDPHARTWFEQAGNWHPVPTLASISLEAAKYHWETGRVHAWSFKRIDPDNPRKQWHAHGWDNGDVACHHEFRPRFERIGDETYRAVVARLRKHYRGEEYVHGAAPADLRHHLDR